MKNFKDKNIVITGAASGIGRALALEFAKRGANVCISDVNADELEQTVKLLENYPVKVFSRIVNVANNNEMLELAEFAKTSFGNADIMINNAGVALGKMTIEETTIEEFKWLMDINFWGMVYGTKAFLPQLKNQKEAALINISSLFGLIGVKFQGAYCASKFGIRGFNEALMAEMADTNIQIHSVHPGGIKTNIARNARGGDNSYNKVFEEKFFNKTPEMAAQTIIRGIEKNKKRILIGRDAKAGDFVSRLVPVTLINFLQKHLHKELN